MDIYKYLTNMAKTANQFSITAIIQEGDPLELFIQPISVAGDILKVKLHSDGTTEVIA